MDHLVGTPALKPYLHGYFVSLKLYDAARVIANPYVYEEHRARLMQEKLDKLAESRIRTRKDQQPKVKVNKALAEKIAREQDRAHKHEERKAKKATSDSAMEVDGVDEQGNEKTTLLNDARFQALFEDPEFQVDEESREFALLNPSTVAQRKNGSRRDMDNEDEGWSKGKTVVEDEEEESDKAHSDTSDEDEDGAAASSDSSDAGGKLHFIKGKPVN
jgi:ribosome biogenesis protein ENP2